MKNIILFISVLACSLSALANTNSAQRRANGLLRFIAQQHVIRNAALTSVIGSRCNQYLDNYADKTRCKDAVKSMMVILDYDIVFPNEKIRHDQEAREWTPKSFVFVAFKKNLVALLNAQKTGEYLNDLNLKLYKYLTGEKSDINIWEITKLHYRTDYMASQVIATLFQDTSIMKLHIAYLEQARLNTTVHFYDNKELLSRVIDTINLILDSSEDHYRSLFYPKEIQKDLNRNIYHFWVPHFLAKALEVVGYSKDTATRAPLMLTLSYEFITAAQDYRYLYSAPENIKSIGKIKDIYGGYCGSNLAVRGLKFFRSFDVIRATFEESTEDGVQLLLKH